MGQDETHFRQAGEAMALVLVLYLAVVVGGGGGGQGAVGAAQGLLLRVCAGLSLVRVLAEVPVGAWRVTSPTIAALPALRGRTSYGASLALAEFLSHIITQHVGRMRSK